MSIPKLYNILQASRVFKIFNIYLTAKSSSNEFMSETIFFNYIYVVVIKGLFLTIFFNSDRYHAALHQFYHLLLLIIYHSVFVFVAQK